MLKCNHTSNCKETNPMPEFCSPKQYLDPNDHSLGAKYKTCTEDPECKCESAPVPPKRGVYNPMIPGLVKLTIIILA